MQCAWFYLVYLIGYFFHFLYVLVFKRLKSSHGANFNLNCQLLENDTFDIFSMIRSISHILKYDQNRMSEILTFCQNFWLSDKIVRNYHILVRISDILINVRNWADQAKYMFIEIKFFLQQRLGIKLGILLGVSTVVYMLSKFKPNTTS